MPRMTLPTKAESAAAARGSPPLRTARSAGRLWGAMLARFRRPPAVGDMPAVADFIARHSAHAAQSSLYGYIKTRAGFEYFRLFDDEQFVSSVNIAKWNLYAVCAGDLALFCGAHLRRRLSAPPDAVAAFMEAAVARALAENADPPDAGPDYPRLLQETAARVQAAAWENLADDETAFSRSPAALVHWAPIEDSLKNRDADIVRNSISFKWKETRDKFRRQADPSALQEAMGLKNPPAPD